MTTIVTVLKTGGDFEFEHVDALRRAVEVHAPGHDFACLTDDPEALLTPWSSRLRHGWPGWWSKIEAFRVPGPAIYMDIDTIVRDDLSPLIAIAETMPFTVLRDFNPKQRVMGSGLMAWSGSMAHLFDAFIDTGPDKVMAKCTSPRWFGDQGFIEMMTDAMETPRTYWQDLAPGAVVSYKKHCLHGVPDGARVICYHGQPRPWETGLWNGGNPGRKSHGHA